MRTAEASLSLPASTLSATRAGVTDRVKALQSIPARDGSSSLLRRLIYFWGGRFN